MSDHITGPLPPLPRRTTRPRWFWPLVIATILCASLAAAVVFDGQRAAPANTVRGFLAATEARDASRMLQFLVPGDTARELAPELHSYIAYVRLADFVEPQITVLSNDGAEAQVRVQALLRYELDYGEIRAGERNIDTTFVLARVAGGWYLRSASDALVGVRP